MMIVMIVLTSDRISLSSPYFYQKLKNTADGLHHLLRTAVIMKSCETRVVFSNKIEMREN